MLRADSYLLSAQDTIFSTNKKMDIERFKKLPIMGILRGSAEIDIGSLLDVSIDAGLEALEITMNTPGAETLIKMAVDLSGEKLQIGAGTVTTEKELEAAINSGAGFIVMPVTMEKLVKRCGEEGVPVFPGALTPLEIFKAWDIGATMVKVFPSGRFGAEYFKEIKGPFDKIELMAVGGVNIDNIKEYFSAGASAVAFGSSVFSKELLDNNDLEIIGGKIRELVDEVKKYSSRC